MTQHSMRLFVSFYPLILKFFFLTKLMDFENSEIGGCCKFGAGGKFSLKFGLQLAVSLAPKPADVQICRFNVTADWRSQHHSQADITKTLLIRKEEEVTVLTFF